MSDKTTTKPERKKVADPEVKALAACDEALAGLDDDAQHRVLNWINDKYGDRFEPAPAAPKE